MGARPQPGRDVAGGDVAAGSIHVVIVGGGVAGVACAKRLANEPRARVTLLDGNGYHQFQPLLYQIATAELAPMDIRFDLAEMFARHANVDVRTAEVVSVDPRIPSVSLAHPALADTQPIATAPVAAHV